ncbi:DUF2332 family protein, partial [Sedimentibacter sp. B4]|uniref:DUF2332 family protein n=1 Tax=Sedimentibacter sp. B4 TaxID=304766 RepID=UPI0012FA6D35
FLAFCADHSAEVRELVATRLPQTNEVGRASVLVAALGECLGDPGPPRHRRQRRAQPDARPARLQRRPRVLGD